MCLFVIGPKLLPVWTLKAVFNVEWRGHNLRHSAALFAKCFSGLQHMLTCWSDCQTIVRFCVGKCSLLAHILMTHIFLCTCWLFQTKVLFLPRVVNWTYKNNGDGCFTVMCLLFCWVPNKRWKWFSEQMSKVLFPLNCYLSCFGRKKTNVFSVGEVLFTQTGKQMWVCVCVCVIQIKQRIWIWYPSVSSAWTRKRLMNTCCHVCLKSLHWDSVKVLFLNFGFKNV